MTRRVTVCMSYGETRTERVRFTDGRGGVTLERYVTACGRLSEDDESINHNVPYAQWRRPAGMCPRCWAHWRSVCFPAEEAS
jgi:hypothetical protein